MAEKDKLNGEKMKKNLACSSGGNDNPSGRGGNDNPPARGGNDNPPE